MVQTRSEETGLANFQTIKEAIEYAARHEHVWKVSFNAQTGERVRLIKIGVQGAIRWVFEPIGVIADQ